MIVQIGETSDSCRQIHDDNDIDDDEYEYDHDDYEYDDTLRIH